MYEEAAGLLADSSADLLQARTGEEQGWRNVGTPWIELCATLAVLEADFELGQPSVAAALLEADLLSPLGAILGRVSWPALAAALRTSGYRPARLGYPPVQLHPLNPTWAGALVRVRMRCAFSLPEATMVLVRLALHATAEGWLVPYTDDGVLQSLVRQGFCESLDQALCALLEAFPHGFEAAPANAAYLVDDILHVIAF